MKKKLLLYLDPILGASVLICGFFLLWQYFVAYSTYGAVLDSTSNFSKNFFLIIIPFLLIFLALLGAMFWQRIKITLAKMALFLYLGLVVGLLLIGILQPQDVFANQNIFSVFLKLLLTFGVMIFGSIVFTLILIVTGKIFIKTTEKIVTRDKELENNITKYLLYFFVGFFVISFLGFFLAKAGFFILPVFVSIFVFIITFFWSEFKGLLNKFFTQGVRFNVWHSIAVSLVLSVVVLNFLQTFFPFSIGWDSSNHYLLTTKLLMEGEGLRGGIFPPFVEIVLAIFGKFFGLSGVQFLLVFFGSLLPFTFYMVGKYFKIKEPLNILLALSFFLIPAIGFQLSKDVKFDIIYLQLLLIVLVHSRAKIALLLLGFAPLMKLTAFWFFPVAFLAQFVNFSKKRIKEILFSILLLILPFSIWGIFNLVNYGEIPTNTHELQNVLLKGKDVQPKVKIPKVLSLNSSFIVSIEPVKTTENKYNSTSFQEEVGRYSGFETNFFKKIWSIFTSPNIPAVSKQYVDLGFLWIIFLPILIFVFYEGFRKKDELLLLGFLATGFFIPWIFMTEGVAWYGLPFLAILFILVGKVLTQYEKLKITNLVIVFFVLLSVFTGLYSRLSHSGINQILTSLSWASIPTTENADRLANVYFTEERKVADILNEDPDPVIFRIGTLAKFWLSYPDARVVEDPQLDIWSRIIYGRDVDGILSVLKDNNIKYLLIDRGTVSIETDKNGTLHKKFQNLQDFVSSTQKTRKTSLLFYGKRIILLKIGY